MPAPPPADVDPSVTVVGSGGRPRTGLPATVQSCPGDTPLAETPLDDSGNFEIPLWLTGEGTQTLSVSQIARSLFGRWRAESDRVAITVRLRPGAPAITRPETGTEQPNALAVDVRGSAAPGATVHGARRAAWRRRRRRSRRRPGAGCGRFAVRLSSLVAGTYRLTARATLDGATGPESQPPGLIALGDATPPTVAVARNPVLASAQDESGADVDIASLVRASDDGAPLPASSIACSPAQYPIPRFPVGSTSVTCEVYDAAGNRGATTFVVTVTSAEPPSITGTGLIAEAQGPAGAVVSYQLAATGFAADCAPAGSGGSQTCDRWRPVNRGLAFTPLALAMNTAAGADRGVLYTMISLGDDSAHKALLRMPPGGAEWEPLGTFDATVARQIAIGVGTPPALFVPVEYADEPSRPGIKVSRDGGWSWSTALEGIAIGGIAADPHDVARLHFFAWRSYYDASGPTLYETHDGWVTWSQADQGLPPEPIKAVAMDPLNADRIYVSVAPTAGDTLNARMFRRATGSAPWEPLGVPSAILGGNYAVGRFFIAPTTDGCGAAQRFPTIFAGHLVSRDGGDSWLEIAPPLLRGPEELWFVFDRSDACVVYGGGVDLFYKSLDGGRTWPIGGLTPEISSIIQNSPVQDLADPRTLYLADYYRGVLKTTDGGATWSLLTGGPALRGTTIYGLAADPVDPNIVVAVSNELGVIRSTDGGEHWQPSNRIPAEEYTAYGPIMIDPLGRNRVYTGRPGEGVWALSLDGGMNWAPALNDAGLPAKGAFALDPLAPGHWLSADAMDDGTSLRLRDNAHIGGTGELVVPVEPSRGVVPSWYSYSSAPDPYRLQMVPDAARTVVVSRPGDISMFSLLQAQPGTPLLFEGGGLRYDAHYDGSDGTHRLFIDGGKIGRTPNVLHRTTLAEARRGLLPDAPWEPLGGDPGLAEFSRLIIDPASGGQKMYTLGARGTLWESQDGGRSWRQDGSTPSGVTALWLSPADGALYATLAPWPQESNYGPNPGWGFLWKRAPDTGAPAGGRIRKGDLRVTCSAADPGPVDPATGLPLRATASGSTFALGDTILNCAATDVFGNAAAASITISVRDTMPPVITLDSPPAPAVAPAGGTAPVSFAVSARDAVDGSRPVSCTHESGAAFPIGVTTVTCTAADARTPPHAAQLSFPIIVSAQGGPALGVPTLVLPGALEATGPAGAPLVVTARTWGGAPLAPACTPALGAMLPIGITATSCSATDPETKLSVTQAADVVVRDTTAPTITVPGDLDVDAQGAFGARVSYAATASDAVDGAVAVSCVPDAGAVFPLGTTPVSCRAVDGAGNQGFAYFAVTIADRSPAALHLADMTVDADDSTGARVVFTPPPSATDVAGGRWRSSARLRREVCSPSATPPWPARRRRGRPTKPAAASSLRSGTCRLRW